MTTYSHDARFHARKIDHYHAHGSYAQACPHLLQLEELLGRAYRSKRGKCDAQVIQAIIEGARAKMAVMKEREKKDGGPG